MFIKKSTLLLGGLIVTQASLGANAVAINFNPGFVQATPTLYDMPFKGEDLKENEKIYRGKEIHSDSGSQKYGYDLSAKRYDTKNERWTSVTVDPDDHWRNPENSNYVVYGKPVYAIADGDVVKCWRNAPENPRSKLPTEDSDEIAFEDRKWLHWAWRQKRMHAGGNHLQMELSGGKIIRYSHFIPGSIPPDLCPNNAALYSAPNADSERNVPTGKGASIKRGQFLGLVGNSGNSTGPHLHAHIQNGNQPQIIRFRRGLATPLNGDQANINNWTRFAGKQIPPGPVLIWPPRTVVAEYARHGYPQTTFQGLFDHLADSGYKPAWLDGYALNGKPFYNMIWRPANLNWRAFFGKTSAGYQNAFDKAKQDGFAPVQVDVHKTASGVRYNVIFEKKNIGWYARHNLTYPQHLNEIQTAKNLKMSPVNIAVASVNGQRRYTVLYHKKNIGSWVMKSRLTSAAYQNKVTEQKNQGRSPVYVNAYKHNGQVNYTALFANKPAGSWVARHGLTALGYQSQWAHWLSEGYLTSLVAGIDGHNAHRFAAVWRK